MHEAFPGVLLLPALYWEWWSLKRYQHIGGNWGVRVGATTGKHIEGKSKGPGNKPGATAMETPPQIWAGWRAGSSERKLFSGGKLESQRRRTLPGGEEEDKVCWAKGTASTKAYWMQGKTLELGKPARDFSMAREQGVCMWMSVCSWVCLYLCRCVSIPVCLCEARVMTEAREKGQAQIIKDHMFLY